MEHTEEVGMKPIVQFRSIMGSRVYDISNCQLCILHVDATCRVETPVVGFGGVIGSSFGSMMAATHGFHNLLLRPMGAQASAIYEGLRLVARLELSHILALSDSLAVIQMTKGSLPIHVEVANYVAILRKF